jgi:hypothetical protein
LTRIDEDLTEERAVLRRLQLERALELLLGQQSAIDEECADQARLENRCVAHATSIGNPSFGL